VGVAVHQELPIMVEEQVEEQVEDGEKLQIIQYLHHQFQ
tara:strand:+ start:203 stop:319 length:117 start_codon:yes stop_codon:yes gene_type:complete